MGADTRGDDPPAFAQGTSAANHPVLRGAAGLKLLQNPVVFWRFEPPR